MLPTPMSRRRKRLNWLYDNELEQFTTPAGRVVTLHEIAQLLQDHVTCHFDFAGPWSGWQMRGAVLIPPAGRIAAPTSLHRTRLVIVAGWRALSVGRPNYHWTRPSERRA